MGNAMYFSALHQSQAAIDERLSEHIQVLTWSLSAKAPKGTKPEKIAKDAARIATLMAEVKHPRRHREDLIAWGDKLWEISDLLNRYGLAVAPFVEMTIVPRVGDLGSNYQRWDGTP